MSFRHVKGAYYCSRCGGYDALVESLATAERERDEARGKLAAYEQSNRELGESGIAFMHRADAAEAKLAAETARRESAEALLRRINDPDNYTTDTEVAHHFARYAPEKENDK